MSIDAFSSDATSANVYGTDSPLPGISSKTWDRFSALKKRRELQSRRSTEKRVKDIKSSLVTKIEAEFSNPDELAALHSNNVQLDLLRLKETRHKKATESHRLRDSSSTELQTKNPTESSWSEIKPFLGINSHLNESTGGSAVPKSGLELSINRAVALREYDVAEKLSDRLAARDLGTDIAEAIDAKRFLAKREHETAVKKAAKKKRLAWGFEPKHRWETKGNM